ncbi:MAG TPA: Fe-S cluster assembly protein SufD [Gemmatimonadales bacterium]|nr:Fe-S cluster assembly protein SufD [Gemmatimonadales bacterium]
MTAPYVEAFERSTRNGGGKGPAELVARRRDAFDRFVARGFPTTKDEDWRFTPVAPITRTTWRLDGSTAGRPVTAGELEPFRFGQPDWCTLVFVDGRFRAELSHRPGLPAGVTVEPLAEALARDPGFVERSFARVADPDSTAFSALNAALAHEGAVIRVGAGLDLAQPIHLLHVTTPDAAGAALQTRTILAVERGARAQFVESFAALGDAASFTNAVTEVSVGENAWVEHSRIQRESESAYHVGLTEIAQARDSHYRSFTLSMGGALARHDLRARLNDENVECLLYGLYLGRGDQLVDNHTVIRHEHPNCRSWEVYKGILDDRSHAVFNGKVFVTPEAQKTDAKQTNRNLLLSDTARVDTKPQLEIFADDVKCTHGATVGRLDEIAFFYMQSRGIPRDAAQQLLIYAFAAEVVTEVASLPVREALDQLVHQRLGIRA